MTVDAVNAFINFVSTNTPSIQQLIMNGSTCTSGKLLALYSMSNSEIATLGGNTVTSNASGNVSGNLFKGFRTNVTLSGTTTTPNIYLDNNTGASGIDGDSFTAANTACTGALTTSVVWKLSLSSNGKQATLSLPATTGTTTAATNFAYGIAIPAAYRPGNTLRFSVNTEDNGASLQGLCVITASTGVIQIFKDATAAVNFTNGDTGGLPSQTCVTWLVGGESVRC